MGTHRGFRARAHACGPCVPATPYVLVRTHRIRMDDRPTDVDFDALAQQVMDSNGAMDHLNALYAEAFRLPTWYFVARGELPEVHPYVASNAGHSGGRAMVRAFTDTDRLYRFAQENGLLGEDGQAPALSIPVGGIVEYLEAFIQHGAYGIWFNSDSGSNGFSVPLQQLRPIREHLARLGLLPPSAAAEGAA